MDFSLLRYVILGFSLNLLLIIVDSQHNAINSPESPQPPPPPSGPHHPPPPKVPSGPHSPPPIDGSHHSSPPPHSNHNATLSPPPPHLEDNPAISLPPPPPPPPPPQIPLQPNRNSSVVTDQKGAKKVHTVNTGKKVGLLFIGIAGLLQICVVGFLVFKRQQLMKIKERNENRS